MKPAVLVALAAARLAALAAAGLAALPVASCSVHRRSDAFACDPAGNGSECGTGRVCRQGFCVESGGTDACPGPCTSCGVGNRTCEIDCTGGTACGGVQCPAGYDCTIRCSNGGTCGDVDCAQAHSRDVTCAGPGA